MLPVRPCVPSSSSSSQLVNSSSFSAHLINLRETALSEGPGHGCGAQLCWWKWKQWHQKMPSSVITELQPAPVKGRESPPHHSAPSQSSHLWEALVMDQNLSALVQKLLSSVISEPDVPTNNQLPSARGKLQLTGVTSNSREWLPPVEEQRGTNGDFALLRS